jgi:hypothetical protein
VAVEGKAELGQSLKLELQGELFAVHQNAVAIEDDSFEVQFQAALRVLRNPSIRSKARKIFSAEFA